MCGADHQRAAEQVQSSSEGHQQSGVCREQSQEQTDPHQEVHGETTLMLSSRLRVVLSSRALFFPDPFPSAHQRQRSVQCAADGAAVAECSHVSHIVCPQVSPSGFKTLTLHVCCPHTVSLQNFITFCVGFAVFLRYLKS